MVRASEKKSHCDLYSNINMIQKYSGYNKNVTDIKENTEVNFMRIVVLLHQKWKSQEEECTLSGSWGAGGVLIYAQHINLHVSCWFMCSLQIYVYLVPIYAPHCCFTTQLARYQPNGKLTCHDPPNDLNIFFLYFITIFTGFRLW